MVAPLVIPLAVVIAAGASAAGKGVADIAKARSLAKDARLRHEAMLAALESAHVPVHESVSDYGNQQLAAVTETVGRFADWIERNQMAVNRLGHDAVDGVEVTVPELPEMKSEVMQARGWIAGGFAGASAAAAAPSVALMGVSAFGSAGTGVAISGLGGAAATNATLAWLGGGALATGGGGMAAGGVVLNLIAVAPAALIGGITVAIIGSKQKTSAKKYTVEVNVAIENIQSAISLLPKVAERVAELSAVLRALVDRAEESIDALEALSFDPDLHAPDFTKALQLVRGIREVVNTPLIDAGTGELTAVSLQIVRKYQ
jgi:hypothetical protein